MKAWHGLGSFFLLAAFVQGLFVLIGQTSNRSPLLALYFVQTINRRYNLIYNFGLWNYCQGTVDQVQSCSRPTPIYNWATTPGFSDMLPQAAASTSIHRLSVSLFVLYFIGTGISFILWVASLASLGNRRSLLGRILAGFALVNFAIMLACLILALVLVVGCVKRVSNADWDWSGHAGNSMWLTIAATVALFLAALCYWAEARRQRVPRTAPDSQTKARDPFEISPHSPATPSPYILNSPPPALPIHHASQQYQPSGQMMMLQQPYDARQAEYAPQRRHNYMTPHLQPASPTTHADH